MACITGRIQPLGTMVCLGIHSHIHTNTFTQLSTVTCSHALTPFKCREHNHNDTEAAPRLHTWRHVSFHDERVPPALGDTPPQYNIMSHEAQRCGGGWQYWYLVLQAQCFLRFGFQLKGTKHQLRATPHLAHPRVYIAKRPSKLPSYMG